MFSMLRLFTLLTSKYLTSCWKNFMIIFCFHMLLRQDWSQEPEITIDLTGSARGYSLYLSFIDLVKALLSSTIILTTMMTGHHTEDTSDLNHTRGNYKLLYKILIYIDLWLCCFQHIIAQFRDKFFLWFLCKWIVLYESHRMFEAHHLMIN